MWAALTSYPQNLRFFMRRERTLTNDTSYALRVLDSVLMLRRCMQQELTNKTRISPTTILGAAQAASHLRR